MVNFDTVKLWTMSREFHKAIDMATADCAAAISFVWCKAAGWGIATNRIILIGSSAGAITVAQLDYCRVNNMTPALELPASFVPAAVVPYSGAIYAVGGKPEYHTPPAPTCFFHGTEDRIVNYKKFPPLIGTALY